VGQPRRRSDREVGLELLRDRLPGNSAKIRLLLDLVAEQPDRVLDVGCGDLSLWEAVGARPEIVGVDVELPAARVGGIERRRASALELPFAEQEFAAVVSTQMLDDLRDRARALREMARVLRPGGALLLTCDSGEAPRPWRMRVRRIPRGPTFSELDAEVRAAGLDVEALRRYGRRDLKRVQAQLSGEQRFETLEQEEAAPVADPREWGLLYVRARGPSRVDSARA
jgi:SAM-dependent methyltransferase